MNSKLKKIKKETIELTQHQQVLDSILKSNLMTKKEFELKIEISRLKSQRQIVYDNNTIVRTAQRPDDVMDKYTQQIEVLEKQLVQNVNE